MANDHLKPYHWAKGQSGNPGGRRRVSAPVSTVYSALAECKIPEPMRRRLNKSIFDAAGLHLARGTTFAAGLALRLWTSALAGDVRAARELVDRVEGKASKRTNVALGDDNPGEKYNLMGRLMSMFGDSPELLEKHPEPEVIEMAPVEKPEEKK